MNKVTFKRKPYYLPVVSKMNYKIVVILLFLKLSSIKNKSSLERLMIMYGVIRNKILWDQFYKFIGDNSNKFTFTNDDTIYKVLKILLSSRLIIFDKSQFIITDLGNEFILKIIEDDDLFIDEKLFFDTIKKRFTEALVKKIK